MNDKNKGLLTQDPAGIPESRHLRSRQDPRLDPRLNPRLDPMLDPRLIPHGRSLDDQVMISIVGAADGRDTEFKT